MDPLVLPAPALADRTPVAPALAPPEEVPGVVLPGVVLPDWLTLLPFEVAEPDADTDTDADGLALVDVDADGVAFGFCLGVLVGVGVGLPQRVPVALAVALPVGLASALAEAVAEAVVVAVLVGVTVGLDVAVAVVPSLGLALLLAGLALVLLAGLVTVAAGVTLGLVDPLALVEGDGDELDGHAIAVARAWLLEMLLGLTPPADADIRVPDPATLGAPPLLWEVIPTAVPSWTMAWRSGATARATPMANTTQAPARADRSSPSRQSRG